MLQVPRLPPVSPSPPHWLAAAGCRPPVRSAGCCSSPRLCLSTKTRSKTLPSNGRVKELPGQKQKHRGPSTLYSCVDFTRVTSGLSGSAPVGQHSSQPEAREGQGLPCISKSVTGIFFLNIRTSTSKSNKINFIYIAQIHNKSRCKPTPHFSDGAKDKNCLLRGRHLEQAPSPGRPGSAGRHEIKASQSPVYFKWHWCECERWYEREHGRAPHWNSCHLRVLPSSLSEECRLSHAESSLNEREKKGLYRKTAHTRTSFTCTAEI